MPFSLSSPRRHAPWTSVRLALLAAWLLLGSLCALGAQDRSERFIGPGVRLLRWTRPDGPFAFQAVEMDRSQAFVRAGVSQAGGDTFALEPLSRQAARLTSPDRYPIAGVNGDYFFYPNAQQSGIPTNAAVLDGELLRTPFQRSCLVIDAAGAPSISILQVRGTFKLPSGDQRPIGSVNAPRGKNELVLYTPRYGATTRTDAAGVEVYLQPAEFPLRHGVAQQATVRAVQVGVGGAALNPGTWVLSGAGPGTLALKTLKPGDSIELRFDFSPALGPKDQVLGGGPRLVRDGKVAVEAEGGSINGSFATTRHPRTAIGFNGSKLFLVVVDGRQPGYSVGMSLAELAQAMADLGCTDALNVDGGGSSALWVRGAVVNRPSDGRERAVANGLFVFSSAPVGDPVRLVSEPAEIAALPGAELPLALSGEDLYYNPLKVPAEKVTWTVNPALGTIRNGSFVAAAEVTTTEGQEYLTGVVRAEVGTVVANIPVRIYPKPARVEVAPATVRAGTETQAAFKVTALDRQGKPLALPKGAKWDATPTLGLIDATGVLLTGRIAAQGTVTATVGGVSGTAQVTVSEGAAQALDDFESSTWTSRATPAGTTASAMVAAGLARSGKRSLRLQYDFTTGTGTRALYADTKTSLGAPFALKLWVYGDGQGAWLRARIRDAKGTVHTVDLARKVDWKDSWRELRAPFSDDFPTPLTLESLYVVEPDATLTPKGVILIDDLGVDQ